jgi:predicted helicase
MSLAMVFVPFCNTKNFEDMKKLVKALYASDESEREHVDFGELLTIGSFDSGTDEDYVKQEEKKIYLTIEEALMDQDGFV